ncbi:MAG: signal recognition particle-docking protein FtsY [Candidatus Aenigmarchaeota archaeon]|nr:signal recognition particle-docking protein FtsY [Candidatus Aenigmarchaeota archaeon]
MFGFLKKKLKENIEKITRRMEKVEETEEPEKITVVVKKPEAREVVEKPKKSFFKRKPKAKPEEPKEEPPKKEPIEEKPVKEIEPKKEEKREEVKDPEKKEEAKKPREEPKKEPEKPKKKFGLFKKRVIEEKDLKDLLWDLQISLMESDVALETAEKICNDLKKNLVGREIKKGEMEIVVKENIKNSLFDILDQKPVDLIKEVGRKKPFVILFLGFNGSGKTTAIARIAHLLKENGLTVNMAAGDTWRAAAINQLEKHGQKLKIPVIKHDYGADSAAVIYDAVKYAEAKGIDVVLADTAGRTHTNVNLMNELDKITKVNKPDMKILVIDSLTGNDAVEQASSFEETVGVDGIILTKMDVNEKGGAALSVSHTIKKPILYIGTGQEYGDLEKFNPRKIIQNLLE